MGRGDNKEAGEGSLLYCPWRVHVWRRTLKYAIYSYAHIMGTVRVARPVVHRDNFEIIAMQLGLQLCNCATVSC